MSRLAKSLALTLPLWFALSCANECNGPTDCLPGQLCQREILPDGERGAAKCVASENSLFRCAVDSDCGDSGIYICRAQRCVLINNPLSRIETSTQTADSGSPADTGFAPDALVFPDAAPFADAMSNPDAMMSNPDAADMDTGTATVTDAGTSTTADGG